MRSIDVVVVLETYHWRTIRTMTVTYVDPRAQPSLPVDPYSIATLDPYRPSTIALLANGFPDSVAFLDHVETALLQVAPADTRVRRYAKPNASTLVSAKVLSDMVEQCDALVTAYGH